MSGCVALRLALPGGVVTWFVTGFRISLERRSVLTWQPGPKKAAPPYCGANRQPLPPLPRCSWYGYPVTPRWLQQAGQPTITESRLLAMAQVSRSIDSSSGTG